MKKQTEKQRIEQKLNSELDYQDMIQRKKNSPKRLKEKSDRFYKSSTDPNILGVREYLTTRVGKANTRSIIREYAKQNDIKIEHTPEFWINVCNHIVGNWDEFLKFEELLTSKRSNLTNILLTCNARFGMNKPHTNMANYAKRLGIPKLDKLKSKGDKEYQKVLDKYFNNVANKISEDGVDKFYDFLKNKQDKRQVQREKRKGKEQSGE